MLLADMVQFPKRNRADHNHRDDRPRDHRLKESNARFNSYMDRDLVRDKYPNFESIGFKSQAFVDIRLSTSGEETENLEEEVAIRKTLNDIEYVILVYTVFGSIDIRCKVVGANLRDIERTAMRIRETKGVIDTTTSIIIDDTDYVRCRAKWANLIRKNAAKIEPNLPTGYGEGVDGETDSVERAKSPNALSSSS